MEKNFKQLKKQIYRKIKGYPEFYQKVWLECLKIKKGQVSTYGEIARRIGHPESARAVGLALAKNPFPPIIPCHRVIRKDGSLGGYSGRGGVKTKKRLLTQERRRVCSKK